MKNNPIQPSHPYDTMPIEDIREIYYQKMKEKAIEKYTFPKKPSSDGYYHMYLKDPLSKKRRSVKAKTLEALKEKAYQFENGISGQSKKTFRTCFEISQAEKLRYVKNKEKTLSIQNTISRNQSEYRRFFEGSRIESLLIEEISKKDIEEIVEANLRKFDLHPKGLASMRSILNAAFTLAYQENWISDNPYLRIDFKKYSDMLSAPTPTEERGYTDAEIERIIHQIQLTQKKRQSASLHMRSQARRGAATALDRHT